MKWDAQKRRYIDSQGKPIPPAKVRQYVDQYIDGVQEEIDSKADELLLGTLTVAGFFAFLRDMVMSIHGNASALARGGQKNADWGRVSERIRGEYDYLDNFEREVGRAFQAAKSIAQDAALIASPQVPAGLETAVEERVLAAVVKNSVSDLKPAITEAVRDVLANSIGKEAAQSVASSVVENVLETERMKDLIWGDVKNRSRMYAEAGWSTYENEVKERESEAGAVGVRRITEADGNVCDGCAGAATEEYLPMDEVSDIGVFECGGRDRCHFEFDYHGIEPLQIDRRLYA